MHATLEIFLFLYSDHVNIESQSGLDVINNSIINAFTNEVKSIVLHCVTVRRHEYAKWIYENDAGLTVTQLTNTTYNSTIQINDTGVGINMNMLNLTCLSEHSKERRAVYVTRGRYSYIFTHCVYLLFIQKIHSCG